MEYITLNCRGDKIVINNEIIDQSGVLRGYYNMIKVGNCKETLETEFYVNAKASDIHEILDSLPNSHKYKSKRVTGFFNIDTQCETPEQKEKLINHIKIIKFMGFDSLLVNTQIYDVRDEINLVKRELSNTKYRTFPISHGTTELDIFKKQYKNYSEFVEYCEKKLNLISSLII